LARLSLYVCVVCVVVAEGGMMGGVEASKERPRRR